MISKTITFTDYDGNERTEKFSFHLTKAEMAEMEMSTTGGMSEMVQRIVEAKDVPAIVRIFKELILKAYGVKSPDGRRFIKSAELTEEFTQTEAYSQLFMELSTNPDEAAKFINGIMPADINDHNKPALPKNN